MKLNYLPIGDDSGIIGYNWQCTCGRILKWVSGGEECDCGFTLLEIDPDDWYTEQMEKPVELRDWNLKENESIKEIF